MTTGPVLAVVKDLFFVARIRETGRMVGTAVAFARSVGDLEAELLRATPVLIIVDLTTPGLDYEALFSAIEKRAPEAPVLGYTTHVLAHQTQPLHARCRRVVTKERLTQDLGDILTRGLAA